MFFFFLFFGVISLVVTRKHYLMSLLSLEFIFLSLFLLNLYYLNFYDFEYFYCIMFLIFGVCDGVLGLSLLVFMVRSLGNDYIDFFSLC
uniref:NADH dehydrogenase subunit 4L n=1 Tax=Oecleopsis sinicus TaxID=1308491 RepID=UPI0021B551A5|nr:NADH dehydrogenase subunit 4L [Oecleopsis sinicus]UVV36483.1 NADH dehydrogenase subunit 4L [Oecleopsis sinicus]